MAADVLLYGRVHAAAACARLDLRLEVVVAVHIVSAEGTRRRPAACMREGGREESVGLYWAGERRGSGMCAGRDAGPFCSDCHCFTPLKATSPDAAAAVESPRHRAPIRQAKATAAAAARRRRSRHSPTHRTYPPTCPLQLSQASGALGRRQELPGRRQEPLHSGVRGGGSGSWGLEWAAAAPDTQGLPRRSATSARSQKLPLGCFPSQQGSSQQVESLGAAGSQSHASIHRSLYP